MRAQRNQRQPRTLRALKLFSSPSVYVCLLALLAIGCNSSKPAETVSAAPTSPQGSNQWSTANIPTPKTAPAPETVDGFDGTRAFEHVRHLVEIGPRVPATDG